MLRLVVGAAACAKPALASKCAQMATGLRWNCGSALRGLVGRRGGARPPPARSSHINFPRASSSLAAEPATELPTSSAAGGPPQQQQAKQVQQQLLEPGLTWPARSHGAGRVGPAEVGQQLTICGWVDRYRNLGGILFLDIRDHTGILQVGAGGAELRAAAGGCGDRCGCRCGCSRCRCGCECRCGCRCRCECRCGCGCRCGCECRCGCRCGCRWPHCG